MGLDGGDTSGAGRKGLEGQGLMEGGLGWGWTSGARRKGLEGEGLTVSGVY